MERSGPWSPAATEAALRGSSVSEPRDTPTVYTGGYHMATEVCPRSTHRLQRHQSEFEGRSQCLFPCHTSVITVYDITSTAR